MVVWKLMIPVLLMAVFPAFGQSNTQPVSQTTDDTIMLEVVAVRASNNPPPAAAAPVTTEPLSSPSVSNSPSENGSPSNSAPPVHGTSESVPVSQPAPQSSAVPVSQKVSSPASVVPNFDNGLDSIRPALSDLNYNYFQKVSVSRLPVLFKEETHIEVTSDYVLHVSPVSVEKNGMIRLNVRLELRPKQEGRPSRNAISTTLVTLPHRLFKLRGLKMENGELVVVMKVSH